MILLGVLAAVVVMFATGLSMRSADIHRMVQMQGPGLYGLALQVFGLPVAALLIGRAMGITPFAGIGLTLVALAPASAASHALVGLAGGHIGLARTLTAWSTLVWLLIMLLLGLAFAMPVLLVVTLLGMMLPLLAGLLIGKANRPRAVRIERNCALIGSGLTGLLLLLTLLRDLDALQDGRLWLTVLLVAGLAMVAGLLGRVFGRGIALTLAISTPMQNIALPLALGATVGIGLPVAIYGLVMYALTFVVLALSRRLP